VCAQQIRVHLKVPVNVPSLRERLAEEGFEVEEIVEGRSAIFNTVDVVSFVVDHVDEIVTGALAGVVTDIIGRRAISRTGWDRGVDFSITTSEQTVIVNAIGDGSWVQVHPKLESETQEEE
jgi:hypothetical protein